MNCVYDAYVSHLSHLGLVPGRFDWLRYRDLRRWTQPENEPTWGGLVPLLYDWLATMNSLRLVAQHRLVTPAHYEADADSFGQKVAVEMGDFGDEVETITLQPAIYLWLSGGHAMFCETVPSLKVVMALQFQIREKGDSNDDTASARSASARSSDRGSGTPDGAGRAARRAGRPGAVFTL